MLAILPAAAAAAPRGAARRRRGARRRLADRDDLAGAGVQHRAVPGARLPAGPSIRRGDPVAVRRARLRAASRGDGAAAGARSSSAATWAPTSPGVHWLYRRGVPLRLLVQRPRHVSRELNRRFDAEGPHPQADLFLRRDLSPTLAVERVLRARAALRDGLAIYLNGDIPWTGPNTCPGRLLGRSHRLLAIWTELAVLTHAPVFLVFCTHAPGGRFALEFEPMGWLRRRRGGTSPSPTTCKQLESRIANSPADAVAHLVWPCYAPRPCSTPETHSARAAGARPSRRTEGLECSTAIARTHRRSCHKPLATVECYQA